MSDTGQDGRSMLLRALPELVRAGRSDVWLLKESSI